MCVQTLYIILDKYKNISHTRIPYDYLHQYNIHYYLYKGDIQTLIVPMLLHLTTTQVRKVKSLLNVINIFYKRCLSPIFYLFS